MTPKVCAFKINRFYGPTLLKPTHQEFVNQICSRNFMKIVSDSKHRNEMQMRIKV